MRHLQCKGSKCSELSHVNEIGSAATHQPKEREAGQVRVRCFPQWAAAEHSDSSLVIERREREREGERERERERQRVGRSGAPHSTGNAVRRCFELCILYAVCLSCVAFVSKCQLLGSMQV